MKTPAFASRVACLAFACLLLGTPATMKAQTCAAPLQLAPNMPQWINTCFADTDLVVVCSGFPLQGRAGIVHLPLPYPVGRVVVQSMTPFYDPALFLLRSHCSNAAICGFAVDSGVSVDVMDLRLVDSGNYFLAIATIDPASASCGQVLVSLELTPQEQALMLDGVFRGGVSAPAMNP